MKALSVNDWNSRTIAEMNICFTQVDMKELFSDVQVFEEIPICKTLMNEWTPLHDSKLDFIIKNSSAETQFFWKNLYGVSKEPFSDISVFNLIQELMKLIFGQDSRVVVTNPTWELTYSNSDFFVVPNLVVKDWNQDLVSIILVQSTNEKEPFAQVIGAAFAYFQELQTKRRLNSSPLLAEIPLLLGVCDGLSFSFLRITITNEDLLSIQSGTPLKRKLDVKICCEDSNLFSGFKLNSTFDDFKNVMTGLCCWLSVYLNPQKPKLLEKTPLS
jgi:hypothetical protein